MSGVVDEAVSAVMPAVVEAAVRPAVVATAGRSAVVKAAAEAAVMIEEGVALDFSTSATSCRQTNAALTRI